MRIGREEEIRLLVRADDFGSTHAANLACIDAYRDGIVRSVELMVPCPWFEEGCRLLNEEPGLDAGVHLVLTSEWAEYRWRPLTHCPSITDETGCFFPMIWPTAGIRDDHTLLHADWRMPELERELRAQIELAMARVPRISHLTTHMGWESAHPEFSQLLSTLERHYGLAAGASAGPLQYMGTYDKSGTTEDQICSMIAALRRLRPGVWLFLEHPAYDHPEMEGLHHVGYHDVGKDRGDVTRVLTSPEVVQAVREMNIRLVSYRDLATWTV